MDPTLPFNLETWLHNFLPDIQKLLDIPDDDQTVVRYWYSTGLRSKTLSFDFLTGKEKIVCFGAGPTLIQYGDLIHEIDVDRIAICSADGATRWLLSQDVYPDFVVTDLDGIEINMIGDLLDHDVQLQVLTHGDNYDKVEKLLTTFPNISSSRISFSTQGKPQLGWENTLGFTDGDRLLCTLIPKDIPILCLGYDLDAELIGKFSKPYFQQDMPLTPRKRIKLTIAQQVLTWISNHYQFYLPDFNLNYGISIDPEEFILS